MDCDHPQACLITRIESQLPSSTVIARISTRFTCRDHCLLPQSAMHPPPTVSRITCISIVGKQKTADQDFGLLYAVSEDLAAYGWLTNTGVKFVVFVSCVGVGGGIREGELRSVFKELQTAYIALVCNPFYDSDNLEKKPITSKKFIREVKRIGESWVPSSAVAASAAGGGEGVVGRERRDTLS
ncbi:Sedlin, N-terminal conserved region-domain-containing protein [Terfezia claveryi]|nr:Sedlin, N-terminal conserved region-domain-containing protein [Terfezia claveryi]